MAINPGNVLGAVLPLDRSVLNYDTTPSGTIKFVYINSSGRITTVDWSEGIPDNMTMSKVWQTDDEGVGTYYLVFRTKV